jgi:signal transduction histidine kinase
MRVAPAPTKTRKRSHILDTHRPRRWSLLAQGLWLTLVILTLTIVFASLPVYVAQLQTSCAGSTCWYTQLTPSQVEALERLGLSASAYAVYVVALTFATMAVCLVVSTLIVWRRSHDRMAFLVALLLVMFGPLGATGSIVAIPSPWRVPNECLYFLALSLLVLVFLLFPSGQFVPAWMRWTFLFFVAVLIPTAFVAPSIPNTAIDQLTFLVSLCELATLALVQLYRYRRVSSPMQRQQTKWVVFGIAVLVTVAVLGSVLKLVFPVLASPDSLYPLALNVVFPILPLLIPLSFGFAVLRSRLWEIDLLINRTLVYGLLTAVVVGIYVLVVGILGTLLHTSGNAFISLLATGLVAVLFHPLRERLQRLVNRLMYGERDEPYAVLSRLLSRLEATLASEALLPTIVETVAQALKLPYAAITLKQGDAFTPAATFGLAQDKLFTLPLVYHSETIGQLLLAPRATGDAFTAADQRLLETIARQAGVAVHAVRLTADLQRSRERLVTAREEERRRLRRDLHDGLGPQLASLTLKLETARNRLAHDPLAETLLSDLAGHTQATVAEIRRLVYALRPPVLDELGLLSALHELTLQESSQISTHLEAPADLPELPAAVEVAIYRIAQEALTNVVRHAQARHCALRLTLDESSGWLALAVQDDGCGLSSSRGVGVGLISMRERAEELGGRCLIQPAKSGGTCILAHIPYIREDSGETRITTTSGVPQEEK